MPESHVANYKPSLDLRALETGKIGAIEPGFAQLQAEKVKCQGPGVKRDLPQQPKIAKVLLECRHLTALFRKVKTFFEKS